MNRALRFRVLTRDKYTCRFCGRSAPDVVLEVDHLLPKSQGGVDRMVNLVTACHDCNQGKSDLILDEELMALVRPRADEPVKAIRKRKPIKKVEHVRVVRRPYQPRRFKRVAPIPVSLHIPYLGPDEPAAEWYCAVCGELNELEGSQCSCRKPKELTERCRECDEKVEFGEWDDQGGRCGLCYEDWYAGVCPECREQDREADEDYCHECAVFLGLKEQPV